MSEYLFQRFALNILQLHQRTVRSWLAMAQNEQDAAVFNGSYAHIDGCYYIALPHDCLIRKTQNAILLIEDDNIRLSWVGNARELACQECQYPDICAALQRRCSEDIQNYRLFELCPQQGYLSINNQIDSALSPQLLQRALYPANERLRLMAG